MKSIALMEVFAESNNGCASCGSSNISETIITEVIPYGSEDDTFSVEVPLISCGSCEFSYTDHRAESLRHDALCHHKNLLSPSDIRKIRERLNMSRREFSESTGIQPASLDRWESGRLIQSESMDTLLRSVDNKVVIARVDRRHLGKKFGSTVVTGSFRSLEDKARLDDARERANGFRLRVVG